MARIYPFRAVRYNTMDVAIGDVVTQPYDKITPSMQQAYYAHSPYNLVRIILGLPELFDVPGENDVYTRAKRDFERVASRRHPVPGKLSRAFSPTRRNLQFPGPTK